MLVLIPKQQNSNGVHYSFLIVSFSATLKQNFKTTRLRYQMKNL